jgi:hypothetical protein
MLVKAKQAPAWKNLHDLEMSSRTAFCVATPIVFTPQVAPLSWIRGPREQVRERVTP